MVGVLDTPAKVLQVSVFQGSDRDLGELGIGANIQIESGNASVDIGKGRDGNDDAGGSVTYSTTKGSASIEGVSTQKSLRDNPIHQLRVNEGSEAYIETGERIPYFYGAAWRGRRGVAGSIEYKDAITGFYVLPRIRGDNVILEVSPVKSSRSNTGGDNIDTQSARTTITGGVGEWLFIGGVTGHLERAQSTTGTTIATQSRGNTGIWIKADLVQ
jgi:type II secretory pathway component GspD/PulD (secretin)